MDFKFLLNDDENIKLLFEPKKGIILHANDLFKIVFSLFFLIFSFYIGFTFNVVFLFFGIIVLTFILYAISIRYNNIKGMKYLISNQRILFIKKGIIKKQISFCDIEEVTYENLGNDMGYIILGKVESLFSGRGINFTEDKYVLDNLTNYKEVSDIIKGMIKSKQSI